MTETKPSDEQNSIKADSNKNIGTKTDVPKQTPISNPKPKKVEDKPFAEFINEDFIPKLKKGLQDSGITIKSIHLKQGERPVVGGLCWMIIGELDNGRRFWVCFSSNQITSNKTISLAEPGTEPSILESFLIDEKKATLPLLTSRVLQRLNGQKWLGSN